MVRIKGVNSDYTYTGVPETTPIKEDLSADPLYLELFICPNNQPSRVEPHLDDHYCNGTDSGCSAPQHSGHVKLRLDQKQGVVLSAKDIDALKVSDTAVTAAVPLTVTDALTVSPSAVEATAPLNVTVASPGNLPVTLNVSAEGVSMHTPNGAAVTINDSGITLTPGTTGNLTLAGNTTISGDLTVTGNATVSGNFTATGEVSLGKVTGALNLSEATVKFSPATIKNLRQRLNSYP